MIPNTGDIVTTKTNRKPRSVTDVVDIPGLGICVKHQGIKDGKGRGKITITQLENVVVAN